MSLRVPREVGHQVNHTVVKCMDHRFHDWINKLLRENDVERADELALGGSSKKVVDGTLVPQIKLSHELHDTDTLWIIDHIDCGGFGGLEAFDNNEEKEAEAHFESLDKAVKVVHNTLPHMTVVTYVLDLEGQPIEPSKLTTSV